MSEKQSTLLNFGAMTIALVLCSRPLLSQTATTEAAEPVSAAHSETIEQPTVPCDLKRAGNLEVLSDTEGVDFGPYLVRMLAFVRENWFLAIPDSAARTKGCVTIEFAIQKNGHVADMKLVVPSGEVLLDRAAWAGITASDPFPPLPEVFHGPSLALRFRFSYNPKMAGPAGPQTTPAVAGPAPPAQEAQQATPETVYVPLKDGVTAPKAIYQPDPEYTDRARRKKINGSVVLSMIVTPDGTVRDPEVTKSLDKDLDKQAIACVKKWTFQPATKDGKPVAVRLSVEVLFHLY